MDVIRLVQGDERPLVIVTLMDDVTNTPLDLSAPTTTVQVKFREQGSNTLSSTIDCAKLGTGISGQIQFNFTGGVLDVTPGMYEGEIIINFDGQLHTVYETMRFRVRDNF
jgi:hypothetical protein